MSEIPALPPLKRGRPSKEVLAERARIMASHKRTKLPPEKRLPMIEERFDVMGTLAHGLVAGHIRSFIVSGGAGVGKSYMIDGIFDSYKERGQIEYYSVKGAIITPINLFAMLYRNRGPKNVLLLDDSDDVLRDETSLGLLKAALDTSSTRRLSYFSEAGKLRDEDIPNEFVFNGRVAFITNTDLQADIDYGKNKLTPHVSALLSRTTYLDLMLHTQEDLVLWVGHIVRKYHVLVQDGLTATQEGIALAWLEANSGELREVSIRTVKKIGDYMRISPNDWEKLARTTLLRG